MQCLPMYSQFVDFSFGWRSNNLDNPEPADFVKNGQYCKSGLAYYDKKNSNPNKQIAKCADTFKVMQKG